MNQALDTRRRELEAVWRASVQDQNETTAARPEVLDSWHRSQTWITPEVTAAPVSSPEDTVARWSDSPLGRASEAILGDLKDVAREGGVIAALTDEKVTITWATATKVMTREAERVHFTIGGQWDEPMVGTNALALAARTGHPSTVFSAEHFAPMVHDWVCYSAPITDPRSGRVLGVIDLSTTWDRAQPVLLTTASCLARCVEYELAHSKVTRCSGGLESMWLRTLGSPQLRVGGVELMVTRRQLELLTVLSLHPEGLTLDELTGRVYGDRPISPSTVKAELSHLRQVLGPRIASRPYRLVGIVGADHLSLMDHLGEGDVAAALDLYGGPLLPSSDCPEIEQWRRHIDAALRDAVVAELDADLLFRFSGLHPDDIALHELALAALTTGDPRRSIVAGRRAAAAG